MTEHPRFPGYDVLARRDTQSWDAQTRRVIDLRLATPRVPRFFNAQEWLTAHALVQRILPLDGECSDTVPLIALLDAKLLANAGDGFRDADMPYMREAWQLGLAALEADAQAQHAGRSFAALSGDEQDVMLQRMQTGQALPSHWIGLDPQKFFTRRILVDVPALFYCQPAAWNEIGFGGPASPRGYVRLEANRHDPWEAAEATPGSDASAERENRHVI